ncbi:hypothetical protein KIN20_021558 [Parelaphostrongylus tenuis]|uniref:USP domain-containing protein n=1 Tax=Parelaphostrongylus tenuis TaxID=148309 RepID=A0AAD5MP29_PARTN|nr:hypothetical protein KIN20_021558 [Parelaphostrongylus tenuis]
MSEEEGRGGRMDLLYVRCTLDHYDTTQTKVFSGALHVDTSENSFKVVGSMAEHKFYAHEFTPMSAAPSRTSATLFSLNFDLSKQHSGRHQMRKRTLTFRLVEQSHSIKEVYEELKKIFVKRSSPPHNITGGASPPVGLLRSRPNSKKNNVSSSSGRHNAAIPVIVPSSNLEPKNGGIKSIRKFGGNTHGENLSNGQAEANNQNILKPNGVDHSLAKLPNEPATSSSSASTKAQSSDSCSRNNIRDMNSTPDEMIIVSSSSGAPEVSASFKVQPHRVTFKSKRNDRSPAFSSTQAKKPALDSSHNQQDKANMNNFDGISSPSFYGCSRMSSFNQSQCHTRLGGIVSPRQQLLADSVSSPRCLSSFGSQGVQESPLLTAREASSTRTQNSGECSKQNSAETTSPIVTLSSTEECPTYSTYSYRGLENLTNSCYMNATLQALASVFPFYYRMQMIHHRREQQGQNCSEFVRRFSDVLKNLVSPDRAVESMYGSATKVSVLEALRSAAGRELGSDPDFGSNVQQVLVMMRMNFLQKTLDILEKESIRTGLGRAVDDSRTKVQSDKGSSSPTFSSNSNPAGVFHHRIRDRYGCERCARANEMTNDAIDLTVTVSAGESIQKMIENALAREEIEYKCEHCGSGPGFICRAFAALPLSLIIVVKRYRFGEAGGSKVEEKINVSRELFLKDLYVDSEVKKQEGVARKSLSHSTESFTNDRKENGHVDDVDGLAECLSGVDGIDFENAEEVFTDWEVIGCELTNDVPESNDAITEDALADPDTGGTCFDEAKMDTIMPSSSTTNLSSPALRVVLSPLKLNKLGSARETKESFGSQINVDENVVVDSATPTCERTTCEHTYPDKENVEFPLSNALHTAVDNGVIRQTGGYLKENFYEEASGSAESGSQCVLGDANMEIICLENADEVCLGNNGVESQVTEPLRSTLHTALSESTHSCAY